MIKNVIAFLLTGVLALFCVGAFLPIVQGHWLRIVFSLGGILVVYGVENVLRLGQVKTCTFGGFSNGECTENTLIMPSVIVWSVFFTIWIVKQIGVKATAATTYRAGNQFANKVHQLDNYIEQFVVARTRHIAHQCRTQPKLAIALASLICFVLYIAIKQLPTALGFFNHESYALLAFLSIGLGVVLYNLANINRVGTSILLTIHVTVSYCVSFLATGVLYQLLSRTKHFYDGTHSMLSIFSALGSLATDIVRSGFSNMVPLGRIKSCASWEALIFGSDCNETSAYLPVLFLWLAIFMWLRYRLDRARMNSTSRR